MSKYFKKLLNKDKDAKEPEKPKQTNKPQDASPHEGGSDRPFDINLDELWQYDADELTAYIHKYEQYIENLKLKQMEFANEFMIMREKLDLTEKERRRLIQDNESLKSKEQGSPTKIDDRKPGIQGDPAPLVESLSKLIRLALADENFLNGFKQISARFLEGLPQVRELYINLLTKAANEDQENPQLQAQITNFSALVDDIEMTLQLITPKLLDVNNKLLSKEKELSEVIKSSFNNEVHKTLAKQESAFQQTIQELNQEIFKLREELAQVPVSQPIENNNQEYKDTIIKLEQEIQNMREQQLANIPASQPNSKNDQEYKDTISKLEHEIYNLKEQLASRPVETPVVTPIQEEGEVESSPKKNSSPEKTENQVPVEEQQEVNEEMKALIQNKDQQIAELNKQINSLKDKINELNKTIQNQNSKIHELETSNKSQTNQYNEQKKNFDSQTNQVAELNKSIQVQVSKINELQKTNLQQTAQITDLQKTLDSQQSQGGELNKSIQIQNSKIQELQKANTQSIAQINELHKTVENLQHQLSESQRTVQSQSTQISELKQLNADYKKKWDITQAKLVDAEKERDKNYTEYQKLFQEYNEAVVNNEVLLDQNIKIKQSQNSAIENETKFLKGKISGLEKEIENVQKKLTDMEQARNEFENKLIQEKLKHHNTQGDLQKIKENLEESQENLNEEIENRRQDIQRNEDLKKKLLESDKKLKDHKRTIKKLSQRVLELQEQVQNTKSTSETLEKEEAKESEEDEKVKTEENQDPLPSSHGSGNFNSAIIASQNNQISALEDQLDKVRSELKDLKSENENLKEENGNMRSQIMILQDKREKGIQEIQKLNKMIENLKAGRPIMTGITNEPPQKKPLQETLNNNSVPTKPGVNVAGIVAQWGEIKKGLEQLYKEVIVALSEQKISEFSESGGKVNTRGSENLIKIEKKVNDIVMMLQDYMETISK